MNTKVYLKNNIRIYVSNLTDVAQEAIDAHQTKPLASLVISTAIAAFGPLAIMKKYGRVVSIVKGDGSLGQIMVEADVYGNIRALVSNPHVITEYDHDIAKANTIPLQLGIGTKGTLKIINEISNKKFGGEVKLAKGDIVTDLAWYFDQSEQIYSAVLTDVKLNTEDQLARAFGVIFQMLPNHNEGDIKFVEKIVKEHKLSNFNSLEDWTKKLDAKLITTQKTQWKCNCSKDKIKQVLNALSEQEIQDIIKEHGKLEVTCNFCNKKYNYNDLISH